MTDYVAAKWINSLSLSEEFRPQFTDGFQPTKGNGKNLLPARWLHYFIGAASMTDFFNGSYTTVCSQSATNSYGTHEMPKSSQGAPMPPTSICQLSIIF